MLFRSHVYLAYRLYNTRCDQKITVIFNFLFIYLFKVTPLRYNTLMPAFFPILETPLKRAFWYRQQLLLRFFFNRSKTFSFHRCRQFWPRTHAREAMCELVRYHGAKSMIDFSTILCVFDELLLANGA